MKFRSVYFTDANDLAKIHLETFEGFFLASLGLDFLKVYYSSCLRSKETFAKCVFNDQDEIIGFSIGCMISNGFHKRLIMRNFLSFFKQVVLILFSRPMSIIRLANNFVKNSYESDYGGYAELLSICVLPSYNGKGIGKELLIMFEEEAVNLGCKEIALTTDFYGNDRVLEFYKNAGYEVYYEFMTYPKRKMFKLKKRLEI